MSIKFLSTATKKFAILVLLLATFGVTMVYSQNEVELKELGKWNQDKLGRIIQNKPETSPAQIDFISSQFLGTPYVTNTLTGDIDTPEVFTVNLNGMDCFTFVDYVEALRLSDTVEDCDTNLKNTRYKNGKVSFYNRNHFFSDWPINNSSHVTEITYEVGGSNAVAVQKTLNLKDDGSTYLPGIPTVPRWIYYIPSFKINDDLIGKLQTGDYIGMYTDIEGLDVSHTGILIKNENGVFLRHASSKKSNRKVVDEDFREYISNVPGIVVYRPK